MPQSWRPVLMSGHAGANVAGFQQVPSAPMVRSRRLVGSERSRSAVQSLSMDVVSVPAAPSSQSVLSVRSDSKYEEHIRQLQEELDSARKELQAKKETIVDLQLDAHAAAARIHAQDSELPTRLAQLEAENARLRHQIGLQQSTPSDVAGDRREKSARVVQRAVRRWIGARRRKGITDIGRSSTNDGWRQALRDVETTLGRALKLAENQPDIGRAPRQSRLQLLANVLQQGVVSVNQAKAFKTLQDMRRSTSNGLAPPSA